MYLQILDLIKNGEFKSGERLPTENELSKRFSSSRNTVRMALNRLRTMGIIDTIHGDGSYVRKVNSDVYLNVMIPALLYEQNDLFDILAFRRGIEVEAVILAAQNADAEDIENLNDICKRLDQVEEDPEKQWSLNTTLHMQMVRCSHSKLFVTMEEIPFKYTTANEITIYGSKANPGTGRKYAELLKNGRIYVKDLVTHTFSLENMSEAIDTFVHRKDGAMKVVIYPNGGEEI